MEKFPIVVKKDVSPFISYLARLSPGSRNTMFKSLKRIALLVNKDISTENFPWHELGPQHTTWIRSELQNLVSNNKLAPDTANLSIKAMRGVIRESWRLGYINEDSYKRIIDIAPIKGTRLPKGKHLEIDEIKHIIDICKQDGILGIRDLALIALLIGGGLRRSEVCIVKISDLEKNYIIIKGKGNKERIIYLPKWASDSINCWLTYRGTDPGYLICKIDRWSLKPYIRESITPSHVLKLVGKRAGNKVKPHDLRRTFIGMLLDAGVDLSTVAEMAGHSQVTTTAKYDRRNDTRKKKAADLIDI